MVGKGRLRLTTPTSSSRRRVGGTVQALYHVRVTCRVRVLGLEGLGLGLEGLWLEGLGLSVGLEGLG